MTRNEMVKLATDVRDEIARLVAEYPEVRIMLHGASMHLGTGLALARGAKDEAQAAHYLRGAAKVAEEVLSGAIARHPEIADRAQRVRDIGFVLNGLANAEITPEIVEGDWFGRRRA